MPGGTRCKADQIAIAAEYNVGNPGVAGKLGVLGEMQRFTMCRDENLRPRPADHVAQFGAARMPGDVHQVAPVGNDLDPLRDQTVDDPVNRFLVAGDGARGKDDAIAPRQRDFRVLVLSNARQRRPRLALATGTKRDDFVWGQIAVTFRSAKILNAVEIARLPRNLHHTFHGAADDNHFTVGQARRVRHRAYSPDM